TRFSLAYLAFFGFMNVYALRVNLSVAILSMVNSTYMASHNNSNISGDVCPSSHAHKTLETGEFNWDAHKRSLVLGAFFYGYILTQLPGGYLASRFGGKWLFGGGVLCTSVLTLLTPVAARTSFALLIVVRVLEGIGEGVTFPAMHAMWGSWAPPVDRSRLVSVTYAGSQFGTVVAQPISGILCASTFLGGWPSVFYVFGSLGVLWCIVWFIFAHSTPDKHPRISPAELHFIQSNVEPPYTTTSTILVLTLHLSDDSRLPMLLSVPWWEIATSKRVWAISIAHFCNNWGFYTLLTCLPTYLKDVLKFDIQQDGFMSALPYLVMWITINLFGLLADYLRQHNILNTTQTRKTMNAIGLSFPFCCSGFVQLVTLGCNKAAAISMICLATAFSGAAFSGFNTNHVDIGSRYAGILMGITNTWATIPGFAGPAVVGLLTEHNVSKDQWQIVFYISAAVYLFGVVAYTLLGTGKEQPWNKRNKMEEIG
uniref:Sialin n=1 Tax=Ciona savignyi TaxID=51511 RepID=H2ZGY0_CIOSA